VRRPPLLFLVLAAVGAAFVALPPLGLLFRAPWGSAWATLRAPASTEALRVSLVVSLAATVLAFVLGVPLAWVLARSDLPGRTLVRVVVVLPLVLPPVVAGIGLLAALGRRGLVGRSLETLGVSVPFTTAAAVLAAAFVSLPLLVLAVEAGIRSLDPRLERAALAMGASPAYVLRRVTLPMLLPQLAAGLVLAWARALGEFGATITFAGNLRGVTQTLPLAVFEQGQTDPGAAIVLSLLLVAISLTVLIALRGRFLPALRTDG
jgi:molybdate transport system permease protein